MQIRESAENYLETILILSQRKGKGEVRSIDIVNELEFSKPSVSVAMKNLRENGYITVDKDGYIRLTDKGLEIAEKMYERHTLLSQWLIKLGVDEKVAVEDACRMEHVVSAETMEKLIAYIKKSQDLSKSTQVWLDKMIIAVGLPAAFFIANQKRRTALPFSFFCYLNLSLSLSKNVLRFA